MASESNQGLLRFEAERTPDDAGGRDSPGLNNLVGSNCPLLGACGAIGVCAGPAEQLTAPDLAPRTAAIRDRR